jgi:seryl-tRNA synthetase
VEQARKEMGVIQKQVAEAKKAKDEATAETLIASMGAVKESIPGLEAAADAIKASLDKDLSKVPNDVSPGVPVSKDEADNAVVRTWGEPTPNPSGLNHHELLWMIGGYEPERGVGVAGHRAYFLTGVGALLNQALISYGLSYLSAKNYTALLPPFFMNRDVMAGVAQLEDFDEQLYKVVGEAADGSEDKYLIATSEQPICVFHKGEWLAEKELPKRYVGYSACFRKEAGSHGRDTWGIFRVHQFDKVEQFVVCEPEHSEAMHAAMIEASEGFYQSLGIAYRVINIVSGELNNAAAIKYDLEGWFPTQATFRELVSCSNCTDYQSRAMEVRCGLNKKAGPAGEPSKKYVHFLNGTLCATTRTICAILENNQVRLPPPSFPPLRSALVFPRAWRHLPSHGTARRLTAKFLPLTPPTHHPRAAATPPPLADPGGSEGARGFAALSWRAYHFPLCARKAGQCRGQDCREEGEKGGGLCWRRWRRRWRSCSRG